MDTRRSYYLASKQDDFTEPASEEDLVDFTDVPYVIPANDNTRIKDRLSARCGALLRRLIGCIASNDRTQRRRLSAK